MNLIYYSTLPFFEHYFQPSTVSEAISLLSQYGNEARILAGGTDLMVLMRDRTIAPKYIINITKIRDLDHIRLDSHGLRIGALATLRAVELSPIVQKEFYLLYEAVHQMATIQVKNMGTVVGNLCRASPAADTAVPLLALEARVEVAAPAGNRTVPLDLFFTGPGETILNSNELATEVRVPKLPPGSGTAFLRVTRVAADLAKINAAVVITIKDGSCVDARIALGAVASTPVRARKAEEVLRGEVLEEGIIEKAAQTAADETKPITDIRSTAEYRKEESRVLVKRAISRAVERIRKGRDKLCQNVRER